jgi:error-prone DNA polymerase
MIRKHAPHARRVVFETGPLSTWFYHALTAEGMPAICIEARHAQKVLNETLNKTDANDRMAWPSWPKPASTKWSG